MSTGQSRSGTPRARSRVSERATSSVGRSSTTPRPATTYDTTAPPATAGAPGRLNVLETRSTTSEEVFQRILRKLQREENFNTTVAAKASQPVAQGQAQAMLSGGTDKAGGGAGAAAGDDGLTLEQRLRRDERAEEDERFGQSPSPATLRAVIDNVRHGVAQKLQLAAVSSIRDTMRLIFESRTLLDKLLKDIPNHGNVVDLDGRAKAGTTLPAIVGGGPAGGKGAGAPTGGRQLNNAVHMKDLFHGFKQAPIHLPLSRYDADPATGKLKTVVTARDRHQQAQAAAAAGQQRSVASSSGGPLADVRSGNRSPEQEGFASPPPDPNIESGFVPALVAEHDPSSTSVIVPEPPSTAAAGTRHRPTMSTPLPRHDQQLLLKHLRRQTQVTETASQTEETMARMVPERTHKYALDRISQLEVHKTEYEVIISRMHAQLDAARAAIINRSKTVATLQETLHRDACLLREKLNQVQMRAAMREGGGAVEFQQGIGMDLSQFHSMLDTVILAVKRNHVISKDGLSTEAGIEEEMRRMKLRFNERRAEMRKQLMDTKMTASLVIAKKMREVRMIKMANDVGKLRDVVIEQFGSVKADFNILKQDVKAQLNGARSVIFNVAQELEYGIRRTAVEVSNFRTLRLSHRALQDVLGNLDDLYTPVMMPEFATGSHPWPYARQQDPIAVYTQQNHGEQVVEDLAPELRQLQRHYANLQRFALRMMQQPDLHTPQVGRPLQMLGYRMLASPDLGSDFIAPVRTALHRDRYLAGLRAKANLSLKYLSFRKDRVIELAEGALASFGYDLESQPIPSSPTLRRLNNALDKVRAKRAHIEEERIQNARALYGMWRTSGVDLWEGKRAPITRDPNAVWAPAPPMSKARRSQRMKNSMSTSVLGGPPGAGDSTTAMPASSALAPSNPPAPASLAPA